MKRFLEVLTVITVTAALLIGCAGGSKITASDGSEAESVSLEGKSVTVITPYLSSVTTKHMVDNLESGFKEFKIDVNVIDTKGDFGDFASRIEDVVSSGTDAMIIVSADPSQVETQLKEAFDAGVPVFGVDSGYIEGMQVNATSSNYDMGMTMGRYLFEDLMGKKGRVIALTYRPHPGVVMRCDAFDELIKEYPDIELITEQQVDVPAGPIESSREIMENLILANPEKGSITAVFAAWDEPAIGATQALQAAGRDEVIVTGIDGNSQAIELINEGTNLKATMSQNFDEMTEIIIYDVVDLLSGGEISTGEKFAPAQLITKE